MSETTDNIKLLNETFNNIVGVIKLEQNLEDTLLPDLRLKFKKHGIQYSVLNDTLQQLQALKNILNEELGD